MNIDRKQLINSSIFITECTIHVGDGVLLNGDLYLPQSEKQLPVIIMRTPYGKHNINAVFNPLEIVRSGFALLVQNVRGRFESTGIFNPFFNEKNDGDATVEWLCNQKWCNKHIYALGVSYEGMTAILIGENKNSMAVASIMSTSNIYRDWFFENHFIKQGFVQSWSHSLAFTDNGNLLDYKEIDIVQQLASDIKKLYYGHMDSFPVSHYLDYYHSWIDEKDTIYWEEVEKSTTGNMKADTYYISGWYDIFCEGSIKQYFENSDRVPGHHRLVIGPWSHTELFGSVVGDVDFGVYSFEKYSPMDIIDWFEKVEKGVAKKTDISLYVMGRNKWYHFEKMPSSKTQRYFLNKKSENRIIECIRFSETNETDAFIFDYYKLVPTCGGRCIDAIPEALGGPKYQHLIENRDDVLVYTSDLLYEDIVVIGEVKVSIVCSSSLEKMDYMIKLCDVDQDGNSMNILDSGVRLFRDADKIGHYRFSLGTVGHCFVKGHKIRCQISASNFPRLNVQDWLIDKRGDNTVYLNGLTYIDLPVVCLE